MNIRPETLRVTPADIETYRRDGVVALRGLFDADWLKRLGAGIAAARARPSPRLVNHTQDQSAPGYYEDFWSWNLFPEFEDFVRHAPCAPIAAALLGAQRINLVMDNWFLREAGSRSRAPFHHDIAYFDFAGSMCVLWLPLEPVTKAEGIAWVRGSHLWDKLFMRVFFKDGHKAGAGPCEVRGENYELPPDVAAAPEKYDLAQFDLELGDCVYFDMRTLHGSLAEVVPQRTVRRYTLRMTAEDGEIRYRGDWAKGERAIFEAAGYGEGDSLTGAFFPQLWPR